jgi:hypothetical protein
LSHTPGCTVYAAQLPLVQQLEYRWGKGDKRLAVAYSQPSVEVDDGHPPLSLFLFPPSVSRHVAGALPVTLDTPPPEVVLVGMLCISRERCALLLWPILMLLCGMLWTQWVVCMLCLWPWPLSSCGVKPELSLSNPEFRGLYKRKELDRVQVTRQRSFGSVADQGALN